MLDLYAELRGIVDALDRAGITYALAGGLAVAIYAVPRATEDIDLLLDRDDLTRAMTALEPHGFRPAGRPMQVAAGRLEIQRLLKIDGTDLLPLDLLIPADPELALLLANRTSVVWEGRPLWVVALNGLRTLKRLRDSRTGLTLKPSDRSREGQRRRADSAQGRSASKSGPAPATPGDARRSTTTAPVRRARGIAALRDVR